MRKGRHRRHMEARALKMGGTGSMLLEDEATTETDTCAECQRYPHADWCMAEDEEES